MSYFKCDKLALLELQAAGTLHVPDALLLVSRHSGHSLLSGQTLIRGHRGRGNVIIIQSSSRGIMSVAQKAESNFC